MSIPLVQNNEKDSINTSIIAIKRQIERINALLGLSNSEEIDTSVFATKDELQQAITDLQPVDEVTADNMQSVTSNAVAKYIKTEDVSFTLSANSWSTSSAGVLYNNVVDVEQSIGLDKTILGFYLIGPTSANYLINFYLRTNGKYISALATSQNASMSGTIRIKYIV